MAITTFATLRTAISDRVARSDFTDTVLKECVALCEARMQREFRTQDMETKNSTFSITGQYVNVPSGFVALRSAYLETGGTRYVLHSASPDQITERYGADTGIPKMVSVVGNQFMFGPAPDSTYTATILYYAAITALSADGDSNWVLTANPDVYLYGSLYEAAIRLQNAELAKAYGALFKSAIDSIKLFNTSKRLAGVSMATIPG
jgi:hypothetical protein